MSIAIKNPSSVVSLLFGWPFVFYFVCLIYHFLDPEISSPAIVVIGILVVILGYNRVRLGYFRLVLPLLLIFFIGGSGFWGHEPRDILRDLSFALTPMALLAIGFWMAGSNKNHQVILKSILIAAVLLAGVHLIQLFKFMDVIRLENINEIREYARAKGSLVYSALVLGFFMFGLGGANVFPKFLPPIVVFPILLVSCIFSYSRTGLLVAVICFLAFLGLLNRVKFSSIVVVAVLTAAFSFIVATTPEDEVNSFRGKIANSVREVTITNYEELTDINLNWRGFEAHKAFETFLAGSLKQQVVGQGFGAVVDLGFNMQLGDEVLQYIPIFHNGYAYIFLKTGWVGFILYGFFYIRLVRKAAFFCNFFGGEKRFYARLLLGISLSLITTMFVVGGMAQMHDVEFVILVGYLYRLLLQERFHGKQLSPE